jgi:hypothetical protein
MRDGSMSLRRVTFQEISRPMTNFVDLPNEIYYFKVARGHWEGIFMFRITSRRRFLRDRLALGNRFLALLLHGTQRLFGPAKIISDIRGDLGEGPVGTMHSRVWIRKFGVTLYAMRGTYVLDTDGVHVAVRMQERFGPIPFLDWKLKEATAAIGPGGMSSTYRMPLLGASWTGRYTVSPDRNHLRAVYTGSWGRAVEVIERTDDG